MSILPGNLEQSLRPSSVQQLQISLVIQAVSFHRLIVPLHTSPQHMSPPSHNHPSPHHPSIHPLPTHHLQPSITKPYITKPSIHLSIHCQHTIHHQTIHPSIHPSQHQHLPSLSSPPTPHPSPRSSVEGASAAFAPQRRVDRVAEFVERLCTSDSPRVPFHRASRFALECLST